MMIARILCLLAAAVVTAHAELPPSAYAEMQEKAPEHLTLHVEKVSRAARTEGTMPAAMLTVTAAVKSVERTATGLKPGDTITISYRTNTLSGGMVGPAPIPALKPDETVPAWLTRPADGTTYAPAAGAYSFRALPLPPPPSS